ncbi:MAG: arylsulfatase [Bacteroidales bacterium]|jgi:arylsulfatase A-like enzyme|nr:arylsulfatase [Bacteroidales bacterium]
MIQNKLWLIVLLVIVSACNAGSSESRQKSEPPNIVIIYMDDLGYGDVGAYGATEIKTPNIDYLAENGLRFTNGRSTSATCSPSRYALLTGIYPWRNKRARVLSGVASLIIDTAQQTLPKMLQEKGYHTGIVGKWHLGLGSGNIDWCEHISPGPNEVGFDYAHIMAATQDRVPTVYIENGYVVGVDPNDPIQINWEENFEGEPTGLDNPELLTMKWHHGHNSSIVNGIPRIGFMKGGEAAKWSDVDMADHFLAKAKEYVKTNKDKPFFLYYAMQQPHVPRTPNPRFVGSTELGPRGDVIVEADWCVGEFMKTLEEEGLLENTLIIFSSDNGPVLNDGYYDDSDVLNGNHQPWGVFRGGKCSLYEAGTRVPFITFWKGKIDPGESNALICHLDFLASLAALVDGEVKTCDSQQLLDVLLGEETLGREELVLEATSRTALYQGDWVMIPPHRGSPINKNINIEVGISNKYQLYNLAEDNGQQNNLAGSNMPKLEQMITEFEKLRGIELNEKR